MPCACFAPLGVLICFLFFFSVTFFGSSAHPSSFPCPQVKDTWHAARRMADVPGWYIGAALLPAFVITVLFWFDHGVSAQMAQQKVCVCVCVCLVGMGGGGVHVRRKSKEDEASAVAH